MPPQFSSSPPQDDELHYAELSLANMPSGSGGASKKGQPGGGVGVSQQVVQQQQQQQQQGQGQVQHPHPLMGGTLPHGSSMRKLLPTIPATATLQRHKPNAGGLQHPHQHAPPPTYDYDYFEEPTIYAQIDAYKTMQVDTTVGAGVGGGPGACISSPGSQGTPSTVSPGTVQMYTLPQHPGGYHTLPHNHHAQQQLAGGPQNSASMMQMMQQQQQLHHHPASNMPPSYQQHQQNQHQQQQQQMAHGQMLVSSNSSGLASTTAAVASPSSSLSGLSGVGKSYSREIVTVRTPLMYSQQESCV